MDNEARKKYLVASDDQIQATRDQVVEAAMNSNFRFNCRNKMGQFGESVLEHLWPYMRRGRRSPNPTIAVVVDHPGMTRDAYNALAVKWGIK